MRERLLQTMHIILTLIALLIAPAGYAQGTPRSITDAAGRSVENSPSHIARNGSGTSRIDFALHTCPGEDDRLGTYPDPAEKAFLNESVRELPEYGRLTGQGGTANLENVLRFKPDLIIDMGSAGPTYVSLANNVQEQTKIPYVLLDGTFTKPPDASSPWRAAGCEGPGRYARPLRRRNLERALPPHCWDPRGRAAPRLLRARPQLARSINLEVLERVSAINVAATAGTGGLTKVSMEFARISNDGDVLDVGCGTGSLAAEIAHRGPDRRVIGLDVAEPYLTYARVQHALSNLHFELGDAGLLPFADGAFAASLAQLVLTFVPNPEQVAAEMVRVTRPGGIVASAVWDLCGGLVYQRILWHTAAALDPEAGRTRDRLFSNPLRTPEGLRRLWHMAGVAEIEIGSLTIRMGYANFDDYWEPLFGGQGPVGTFAAGLSLV